MLTAVEVLVWVYVVFFGLTALGTLIAVFFPNVLRIEKKHVDKLFSVLMLELVGGAIGISAQSLHGALDKTKTIAEKTEAVGRQLGVTPWTRIVRVDRSRTDLSELKRYVENPTEAARLFADIPRQPHSPVTFAPSKTTTDKLLEIRVLHGLDAWIGLALIDSDGTIYTETSENDLTVPESYRLLNGVVFIWPGDAFSNDVITRNPDKAVEFVHDGEP